MLTFLTTPAPHEEAARLIADKPLMLREIFDQLPEEMKGKSFTITGIEDFDVMQAVQDEIAAIPLGADWKKARKAIAAKLSPWLGEGAAEARAKLLLNHHAGQAYAAVNARLADAQIDIFPFRQYHTNHGPHVRDSHAALDKLILPADHPFWATHTPPWQWNCHCIFTVLTAEDRDEESSRDAKRLPEDRRVLEGAALKRLEEGTITRGPEQNYQLGKSLGDVRATTMPYDEIKTRWEPEVAAAFETWAGKQLVSKGKSLLEWLTGDTVFREGRIGSAGGGKASLVQEAKGAATMAALRYGTLPPTDRLRGKAHAIRAEEARISRLPIEHGTLFSATGTQETTVIGDAASVELPEGTPTQDRIFTHNHPSGESFSPGDIARLFGFRLAEIRAVTRHGVYSATPAGTHRTGVILDRIDQLTPDAAASLRAAGLDDPDPERYLNHLLWSLVSKEGLINYSYTPMRPEHPILEALSAKGKTAKPADPNHDPRITQEDRTFRSYPMAEYKACLEGKGPLPGMAEAREMVERLSL